MTTEREFLFAYERIKSSYKSVMAEVATAISHEEHERPLQAIAIYEHCLQRIEEAFSIPVGLPEHFNAVEPEWNDACAIIQKLKSAKTEVAYRLKMLRSQHAVVDASAVEAAEDRATTDGEEQPAKKRSLLVENPATHYDITNSCGTPKTYREIINGLRTVIGTRDSHVLFDTLFQSQAKLYKIQPNGVVATMAGETSMSLVMCTVGGEWQFLNGVYFIQCTIPEAVLATTSTAAAATSAGELKNMVWIYALVPNVTTCHRTEYGAFILPDIESDVLGGAFGIMLKNEEAAAADAADQNQAELSDLEQFFLDLLEAVLSGKIEVLRQPFAERPPRDTSQVVSRGIVNTADFIARNLVRGAEKTGELMIKSTPYLIARMQPAAPDVAPVSSNVQKSVEVAKHVTSAAVVATGWVADKVGCASMALGRFLSPHIHTQGAALLQKGFGYDSSEANSKMEGALAIAAGAVEGFSTVFNGLETSAKILGTNLSDNSVKIIEHKYGPSAGNVAAGTFDTIGNAFNVSQNVNYITPKGIAKKMAKNTGKAVVDDYKRSIREESHFVPAGSLYPDLRALKEKQG